MEIPESIFSAQQLVMIVADSWGTAQRHEPVVEAVSQPVCGVRAVLGKIVEDVPKVTARGWR